MAVCGAFFDIFLHKNIQFFVLNKEKFNTTETPLSHDCNNTDCFFYSTKKPAVICVTAG